MKEPSEDLTPPKDLLTSKQIQKLNLEIQSLRENNPWDHYLQLTQMEKLTLEIESLRKRNTWEPYSQLIPLAGAIVLALGLVWSVVQFLNGQQKEQAAREREQRTRVETQIRTDQDEIFKLARDETKTFSGISFLFADLERATGSRVTDDPRLADEFQVYRRPFTEGLFSFIRDLDLKRNPRGLAFALLALDHWDDYKAYLGENPAKFDFILNAYVRGLSSISEKYPNYLEGIRIEGDQFKPLENENVEGLWPQFLDIVSGFKKHAEQIDVDPQKPQLEEIKRKLEQIKKKQVKAFVLVINNEKLAKSLLGHLYDVYIDPKSK